MTIDSITSSPGFNVLPELCIGPILPKTSCTMPITYTPGALNAATGSITVTYNSGQSTLTVPATGSGIAGEIEVSPAALDFGKVAAGAGKSRIVKVVNKNAVAIDMGPYNIAGPGAGFAISDNTCASSVDANGACEIEVTFTPAGPGKQTGTLSIGSFTKHNPTLVKLTGTLR